MAAFVYRIMSKEEWHTIQSQEFYLPEELKTDGFVHLSCLHQVIEVANFIAAEQENMLLLKMATAGLHDLRSEDLYGYGQDFPHLYGPLPLSAVVQVLSLEWKEGTFHLPESPPAQHLVFDQAQRLP